MQNILNFAEFKENCIKNQKFFLKPSVKNEDQEIEISYPTIEDTIPGPEEEIDPDSLLKTEDDNVFKKSKRKTKKNEITIPATSHRKQSGKEIYQKLLSACEFCGKLIEKNRMEGHRNQHLGIRPYTCDENDCSKTFHCKHLLRLHKSSMHTGKQISCPICEKVFPSYRSLYAHKMRHENKDKFHCEQCNKKFNTRNSLKRHMPSHSGIRNYNCNFCSMSFYRNYNLLVHIRTHTKEKLYVSFNCIEILNRFFAKTFLLNFSDLPCMSETIFLPKIDEGTCCEKPSRV